MLVSTFFPGPFRGHLVLDHLERIDGQTFVVLMNPWGEVDRLSYEDFAGHFSGVVQLR